MSLIKKFNLEDTVSNYLSIFEEYLIELNSDLDSEIINYESFDNSITNKKKFIIGVITNNLSDSVNVIHYVDLHNEISLLFDELRSNYISYDIRSCTAKANYKQYMKSLDAEKRNKIETGFTEFDDEVKGISSGLTILTGLSSLGKSTLSIQLADQIAMQGNKVLYINAEMQDSHIFAKSICRLSGRHSQLSFFDILNIKDCTSVDKAESFINSIHDYEAFADNIVIMQATKKWNIELRRDIKALTKINDNKPPVVFIDYLQILPCIDNSNANGNELVAINETVNELKRIIQETGVYIVAISSLSRAGYEKGISMSSLKGSGNIEYSAEMILAIEPSRDETCNGMPIFDAKKGLFNLDYINEWKGMDFKRVTLRVLKNRMGRTGSSFDLTFESSKSKFTEIVKAPHHEYFR